MMENTRIRTENLSKLFPSYLILNTYNYNIYLQFGGTAVAQWLRRCATNRKVAGSIPDGVTGIFN